MRSLRPVPSAARCLGLNVNTPNPPSHYARRSTLDGAMVDWIHSPSMTTALKHVGLVGLGIMGRPMAKNLLKAGFNVTVHSRTRAKVDELVAAGAEAAGSP